MENTSRYCSTLSRTEVFTVVAVAAAVTPFFLLYLEHRWLPYPELVEELAKAVVVLVILFHVDKQRDRWLIGSTFAFLFSLTENIIYGLNQAGAEAMAYFGERTMYVTPMHLVTVAIMVAIARRTAWLLPVGAAAAVVIHVLYNHFIVLK